MVPISSLQPAFMGVSFVQDALPDAVEEEKDEFDPLLGLESFPLGVV